MVTIALNGLICLIWSRFVWCFQGAKKKTSSMIGLSAAHLAGEGMGSPVPFFEKQKQKWPDLGTKYLDCDRLRGKNSYLECCFKSVWEKKNFFCLLDLSFVRWRWNFHRISHSPRTLPSPEIFLVIQIITVIQLKFFSVNVNPLLGTKLIICRALISEWRRFKNVELSAVTEAATSGVL